MAPWKIAAYLVAAFVACLITEGNARDDIARSCDREGAFVERGRIYLCAFHDEVQPKKPKETT